MRMQYIVFTCIYVTVSGWDGATYIGLNEDPGLAIQALDHHPSS